MLKVSDNFKKACNSDKLKYREFIIIDNKEIDIKGNLSATAYKDTTFFGKFNLKMLTFETENDIEYKGKEFVYYKEVNGESVKIGTFIVTEVKDSDTFESVNVTAYDYGLKFAKPYKTNLNYSSGNVTMYQVLQEICVNCEVGLENIVLPNDSFIVDSNQFVSGEQYGDVICLIALENGMFATINNTDKLFLTTFNKTTNSENINILAENKNNLMTENDDFIIKDDCEYISDYVELDNKRDTRPITCLLVATSEELANAGAVRKDQELIKKYGENWLKIYDYAFAYTSEKCEQLADAIFKQIKGFGYSAFKSNYSFKPYLTLGDLVKIKNKNGSLTNSIVLRYSTNYDEMTIEAPSIINASVDYQQPETSEEKANRALIGVNRANAEIVLKVDSDGKIAQVRLDGNADGGTVIGINGSQINLTADDILNLIAGNTINLTSKNISIDSDNFKVDKDGNMTCNNATMNNADITGGTLNVGSNFNVDNSGKMTCTNADVSGKINSTEGSIGGATIDSGGIYTGSGDMTAGIGVYNSRYAFWAGSAENNSANAPFKVGHEGNLTASNATITGNITATSGKIADYTISGGQLVGNNVGLSGTSGQGFAFWAGSDNPSNAPFRVGHTGNLTATSATISGKITAGNGSTIGGLTMSGGELSSDRLKLKADVGQLTIQPTSGGNYILSDAVRLSANLGVAISSLSDGSVKAPSNGNLDLKACSGATAYLACMGTPAGKTEKSACECANGTLKLRSTGAIYANGVVIGGSSSRATKKNIKDLSQEKKTELYDLIKNIPLKEYDYKAQYGKEENYGFIIEDIENTKLNTLLHIVQNEQNEEIKNYSSEDLARLELVVIQELMKKVDNLQKQINELKESDTNG